jgi:hypothetical protein
MAAWQPDTAPSTSAARHSPRILPHRSGGKTSAANSRSLRCGSCICEHMLVAMCWGA